MGRVLVILILFISSLLPQAYAQEWLDAYNQSLAFYENDQLEESLTSCKEALKYYKREADVDHANYRVILRQLSVICYNLNKLSDGQQYALEEVESWRSASMVDEPTYIDALDNLGVIYTASGEYDKSIIILTESLKVAESNSDKDETARAIIEGHLAEALFAAGNLEESANHFIACLKVLDSIEEVPADYINFCYSYGTLCSEKEDYSDAIKYLTMLFQWYDEADPDPLIVNVNVGLGTAYTHTKNLEKGEHYFLMAKKALEQNKDDNPGELLEVTKLLALNLEQQGRHDEAKELYAGLSDQVLNGENSEEQVLFLNSQATILLNSGKVKEALSIYDQALVMLDSLDMKSTEIYATIGLNAIKAQRKAGNLIYATDLAKSVLENQAFPSATYYNIMAEYGSLLQKKGEYDAANEQFERLIQADTSQWVNRDKAQILDKAATYYQIKGAFDKSYDLYKQALSSISPKKDKVIYQSIMFNYLTLLQAQGKLSEAETLLKKLKNSIGNESPEIYLGILRNMGSLNQKKGKYKAAKSNFHEALTLAEQLSGKNSLQYADILLRMATLDKDMGNYQDSEPTFIQAGEIIAATQGKQNPNYAGVVNNMGILYQQMGNFEKAETEFQQAINIYQAAGGKNNPDYVLSLENLATLYELKGENDKALDILATTLAANKLIFGENNPIYATSLHNYASLLQKTNKKEEAFTLLLKVLKLEENTIGKMQPGYANTLHNLAVLAQEQGNYPMADSLINEVLVLRGALFGVNHPSYTSALFSKAILLQVSDRYQEAWQVYNQVIDQYLNQLDKYFPSLSEKEKNAFFAKVSPVVNRYKEFCIEYYTNYNSSPEVLDRLYDIHLATKALLLNAVNKTRERILNSGNQQLIDDFSAWNELKKQLVNYYGYSKERIAAEGIDIKNLEEEANTMEKSLSKSSALFAKQFEKERPHWQQVALHLPTGSAAIELIRIARNGIEDSVTYVALSLLNDSEHPNLAILPKGLEMEGKYFKYYKNTVKYKIKDNKSFNIFWKPIDRLIGGSNTVYISADGVYNKININTIYNVNTGHYLIEDYFVKYISSTKGLAEPHSTPKISPKKNVMCMGDPAYDLKHISAQKPVELSDVQRSQLNMQQISPLPGTRTEIEYIDSVLTTHNWLVKSYLGANALEKNLKSENAPSVLHLATHGYFMPDLKLTQIEDQSGINDYDKNPLFRSGLLFAGAANREENTDNDGILTAYEAMNLSLDNTELVVLSACETALGDVKNGEGVYGLQRALLVAGANKLIMSLWKVNDTATMELMSLFYTNWAGGDDIYASMQKAQIKMMKEHGSPYFWGAFIMIGK